MYLINHGDVMAHVEGYEGRKSLESNSIWTGDASNVLILAWLFVLARIIHEASSEHDGQNRVQAMEHVMNNAVSRCR
jgi:hypothetical protein